MPAQRGFNVGTSTGNANGSGIGQPQTTGATPFQNFGSESVQLSSPNPLITPGGRSIPQNGIEQKLIDQSSVINVTEWKDILDNLKAKSSQVRKAELDKFVDSEIKNTNLYKQIIDNASNVPDGIIVAMLSKNGINTPEVVKKWLGIAVSTPSGTGAADGTKALPEAEKNRRNGIINPLKTAWSDTSKYPRDNETNLTTSINNIISQSQGLLARKIPKGRGIGFDDYFNRVNNK